jgi:6-pyruvoyltetrahydropterin/6-carboxytetrahydropterin synthase
MADSVPGISEMEIELSDDSFCFPAAHLALHGSNCESMHGHTYAVTLRLSGALDASGMIADFHRVKDLMRRTVEPLRRRVLLPMQSETVRIEPAGDHVDVYCGSSKRYRVPRSDVAFLNVANTTTELLADYILGAAWPALMRWGSVRRATLSLSETPGQAAVVTRCVP